MAAAVKGRTNKAGGGRGGTKAAAKVSKGKKVSPPPFFASISIAVLLDLDSSSRQSLSGGGKVRNRAASKSFTASRYIVPQSHLIHT